MKTSFCKLLVGVAVCGLILALAGTAMACVGARPLSMGGAFVGLADDANATYWNPAGLVQLKSPVVTYMRTTTNRDEINYQDFASIVSPFAGKAAAGVSWVKNNLVLNGDIDEENWYWASLAYQLDPQTSIGVNVKTIDNSLDNLETETSFDVALFHKLDDQWTFGLLVQDVNEPKIENKSVNAYYAIGMTKDLHPGEIAVWTRNWRPGVAFRPDNKSVVTAEIYDLTDDADARSLRLGYEKWMSEKLAVRAGYYGLGMSESDAFTVGFGYKMPGTSNSYKASLEFAAMIGDVEAVLTSLTVNF